MGLNMKRSAFRGQSGHTAFSKGFLCALSISDVCQGVICIFCAVKLNIKKIAEKLIMHLKFYKRISIITNFGPNLW